MTRESEHGLRGMIAFMDECRKGGAVARYKGVPYMQGRVDQGEFEEVLREQGFFETVATHSWSVGVLTDLVLEACPALAKCVDGAHVQKILRYHDMREFGSGDVSQFVQNEVGEHPSIGEENRYLKKLIAGLPPTLGSEVLRISELFEGETGEPHVEILFARFIDDLHGKLTVLGAHTTRLSDYLEKIEQILRRTFVGKANELIKRLKTESEVASNADKKVDFGKASEEIRLLTNEVLNKYRAVGVQLGDDLFLRQL